MCDAQNFGIYIYIYIYDKDKDGERERVEEPCAVSATWYLRRKNKMQSEYEAS